MNKQSENIFCLLKKNQIMFGLWLVFALFICSSTTFGQVTVNVQNQTIKQTLRNIEHSTVYKFFYSDQLTDLNKKVSLSVKNQTIEVTLSKLFSDTQLSYTRKENNQFVIFMKSTTSSSSRQDNEHRVSGVVKDEKGEPIIGANVIEKGTTNGMITDADGKFVIWLPVKSVLQISYIGYVSQEIRVTNKNTLDVIMKEDTKILDEVVVVGYGTMKKSDLTGSISSIKAEELEKMPMTSLDQGIQGRAAGVQVTSSNGAPGGVVSIHIRGGNSLKSSNEPLYVIDGFPVSGGEAAGGYSSSLATNPLATINPSDIESIEILKDASSASIYGSRGSNGVILITTKRGKAGKPKVTYDGYVGVQNIANKLDMMTAEEYATFANEAATNSGSAIIYGGSDSQWKAPSEYHNGGIDWQDMIFRSAMMHNHQISIVGGASDKTTFAVSGNYYGQDGIIINSDLKRGSLRSNIDSQVSSWIKMGLSFTATRTKTNYTTSEGDGGGSSAGVVNGALSYVPTMPMYNNDGSYTTLSTAPNTLSIGNPYATALLTKDLSSIDRVLANAYVKFDFGRYLKGLAFEIKGGTDYSDALREGYRPSTTYAGQSTGGSASKATRSFVSYLNENLLTYQNQFGKHKVDFVGGLTLQSFLTKTTQSQASGFLNDLLEDNNMESASNTPTTSSGKSKSTQASWLGRINYNYAERYLLTLTARADGSSKFGKNNKWGFFPSIAGAWRISEESFMQKQKTLSNLKLRASYGLTGNQDISSYSSIASLNTYNYTIGDAKSIGFAPSKIPNYDLKWETTSTIDVGADFGFLKNRLNLTIDYYYKRTWNMLMDATIPSTSGFGSILSNVGKMQNKGLEVSLSYDLISSSKKDGFNWNTSLMYASNRNKVLDLAGTTPGYTATLSSHQKISGSWLEEGYPVGIWYDYAYDGVYQIQDQLDETIVNSAGESVLKYPKAQKSDGLGSPKFKDVNQDGKITSDDRMVIGDPNPDFIFSWTNNFTYKNFDLSIFLNGSYGNDIINLQRGEIATCTTQANQRRAILDHWSTSNPTSNTPKATLTIHPYLLQSDYLIEDGSYVRLKNITLGYRFNLHKVIESVRVYASAQNLFTITGYSGFDPEVNSQGQSNLQLGVDWNAYPSSRSYLFGINLVF